MTLEFDENPDNDELAWPEMCDGKMRQWIVMDEEWYLYHLLDTDVLIFLINDYDSEKNESNNDESEAMPTMGIMKLM